jgi:hypothetical protein
VPNWYDITIPDTTPIAKVIAKIFEPVLKEVEIRFAAGPEPEPFEDGEIAGKPDGKRGEYEVKGDRKGELESRKRQGGGAFQHASIPGHVANWPDPSGAVLSL